MNPTPGNRDQLVTAVQTLRDSIVWETPEADHATFPNASVVFSSTGDGNFTWTVTLLGVAHTTEGAFATLEQAKEDAHQHLRNRLMELQDSAGQM